MSETMRRILAAVLALFALIDFIVGVLAIHEFSTVERIAVLIGSPQTARYHLLGLLVGPFEALFFGLGMLVLSAILVLSVKLVGFSEKRKSVNRVALSLACLSIVEAGMLGMRVLVVARMGTNSPKTAEIFVNNSMILEIILLILTLVIGAIAAASAGYREIPPIRQKASKENSRIRAGLLGALNAAGYDIADLILTKYDDMKVIILFFTSEEDFDLAIERDQLREIEALCHSLEPGYEVRFEDCE